MLAGLKLLPGDIKLISQVAKSFLLFRRAERQKQNVGKIFESYAKKNPNKVCFYFQDEQWTFSRVQETSNQIGNYFLKEGFKRRDTVSLVMDSRPEYICTWLGLSKIGVIPALVNSNLRLDALQHSIKIANSKAVIFGYELSNALEDIFPIGSNNGVFLYGSGDAKNSSRRIVEGARNIDSNLDKCSKETPRMQNDLTFHDELFYIYTSGTTGFPKAAIIKHARFFTFTSVLHVMGRITENDIMYTTLPLYHSAGGMLGAGQAILFGTPVAIRSKFSASNFWKDCIKYNATCAQYMGELTRYLLRTPVQPEEKLHKLNLMAGNGLRPEIWQEFITRFNIPNIMEFYGSTEGNSSLFNNRNKVGATGYSPMILRNRFPIGVMKLDEKGEPARDPKTGLLIKCGPNEQGELMAKIIKNHPFRDFKGYATDTSANEKKVIANAFEQGDLAFRSGDLFEWDEDGYFYFKDRMGDTFRWKGENVSTTQVEYTVSKLIGLEDVVVYGVQIPGSDGRAGMAALADPHGTFDPKSLGPKLSKALPSYARPLFLRVVSEIEKTGTHKLRKVDLQKEGFRLNAKDKVYFLKGSDYQLMDKSLYEDVASGKLNL